MGIFKRPPTQAEVIKLYKGEESLYQYFPWADYDPENKLFLMDDGLSVGMFLNVSPVNVESFSEKDLDSLHEDLSTYISAIPQKESPFIVQSYSYFINSWYEVEEKLRRSVVNKDALNDPNSLESRFLSDMKNHFNMISKSEGLFDDAEVTGGRWGGKIVRHKWFITRKIRDEKDLDEGISAEDEMLNVVKQLQSDLSNSGVKSSVGGMESLYEFLLEWFNGDGEWKGKESNIVKERAYPGDDELPIGFDLPEMVFTRKPTYSQEDDSWYFHENKPQSIIVVDSYRKVPKVGHLTAERRQSNKYYSMLDKLPKGCVINFTFVVAAADKVRNYLAVIGDSAKGDSPEVQATKEEATEADRQVSRGNYMWPTIFSIYLRGDSLSDLRDKERQVNSLLISNGLHVIDRKHDLIRHHHYITQLPFCYDYNNDENERRSRFLFSSQVAKFLPLYGRSTGSGNFNLLFANRGGEPLMFDVLKDRLNNAFGCILGPPGSGKSALINYILYCLMATKRPRLFLIEKGGSFALLGELLKRFGFSVTSKKITAAADVAMPLFSDAIRMIDEEERKYGVLREENKNSVSKSDYSIEHVDEDDEERDYLGEMELSARMMITGGEANEEDALRRHHRVAIRTAIKNAAIKRRNEIRSNPNLPPEEQLVRPSHVIEEINIIAQKEGGEYGKALEMMAKSMSNYTLGLQGKMFNGSGESWPESDVTILDFGLFSGDSYECELGLTYMSLMQQITAIAERDQMSGVPIFVFGDESHLYIKKPLLASYTVKICKMFRKINCWLWLATQNIEDFPGEAKKMLTMFEWFIAMSCPKKEVEILTDFLDLTPNQQELIKGCRKKRGCYTEGVIIGKNMDCRFRNVPPSIALAVAMTDPEEKEVRESLMKKHGIEELDAAEMMAKELDVARSAL